MGNRPTGEPSRSVSPSSETSVNRPADGGRRRRARRASWRAAARARDSRRPPGYSGWRTGIRGAGRSGSGSYRQGLGDRLEEARRGVEKRPCIGVQRPAQHLLGRAAFDDPAEIHHRDPAAEIARHRQVVGDEEQGQAHLALQAAQQVEQLRLGRYVEARDRLVGHDTLGYGGERAGDRDSPRLAARQLARIAVRRIGGHADAGEEGRDLLAQRRWWAQRMLAQRFADRGQAP